MDAQKKPAALNKENKSAVLLFKILWYSSNVAVAFICILTIYFLFGLKALEYFLVGIAIVAVMAIVFIIARKLVGTLFKMLRKSP